ncbi:MAG TPA: acylphosphatase [Oxalicibacterium sp.]|nr:acylphosphatase [Oxalicibacterium sp.]
MAKHLRIHGIVQGVGYRAGFDAQARALGVSGWVRNRRDGSVEAMIRGDDAAAQKLIVWAHRGPVMARVDQVHAAEVDETDDAQIGNAFAILPTE